MTLPLPIPSRSRASCRRPARVRPFVAIVTCSVLVVSAAACRDGAAPADAPPAEVAATDPASAAATPVAPTEGETAPPATSAAAAMATEVAGRDLPSFRAFVGRGGMDDGEFQLPTALAVDGAGALYVLDSTGIQVFDAAGSFQRRLGGEALVGAQGLAVAPDGSRLYVAVRPGPGAPAGSEGAGVVVLDAESGGPLATLGAPGTAPGTLGAPAAVRLGPDGLLYVADAGNRRVEVFQTNGAHVRTIGEPGEGRGQFTSPRALALDGAGRLYVGQGDHFLVQRFGPDGAYLDTFGKSVSTETLFRVGGVAADDEGRVYVSRAANHYLQVFDAEDGRWLGDFGGLGVDRGELNTPLDLHVAGDTLYVVDQQNHRVQLFDLPPREG